MDPLEGLRLEKLESLHETRSGMPYYNGSAHRFTEWKFKIMSRHRSAVSTAEEEVRKRNLAKLLSDIIDALSDQALRIAMNMSDEEMSADDAINTLITRIEANFNKNIHDSVQELVQAGAKHHGDLCRQHGENIMSYIDRRRRWYRRI